MLRKIDQTHLAMKVLTVCICLLLRIMGVVSYGSGAPPFACTTLDPSGGHGHPTATGQSPYELTISDTSYTPRQQLTVTLSSSSQEPFKGFLILARQATGGSTDPVGTIQVDPSGDVRTVNCSGTVNAATHKDNTVKTSVSFTWTAPAVSAGDVVFHYTVVRSGAPNTAPALSDYFKDLQSFVITGPSTFTKDVACGQTRACYSNCQSDQCDWEMSWQDAGNNNFDIKMKSVTADNRYIALGFSQSAGMSPASVVSCVVFNGNPEVVMSTNTGISNTPLANPTEGISSIQASFTNGILECHFQREAKSSNPNIFNLTDSWHLIAARGPATATTLSQHDERHLYSAGEINPSTVADLSFSLVTTTTQGPTTLAPSRTFQKDAECGQTKGCYSDCKNDQCGFLASWRKEGSSYKMSIKTYALSDTSYIAFAFGREAKMASASCVECLVIDGAPQVRSSFISGESSPTVLTPPDEGLADISNTYTDGLLECTFSRVSSSNNSQIYDLDNGVYHLLAAWGDATADGYIMQHASNHRFVSSSSYSPSDSSVDVSLELSDYPMIKAHGCLMVLAWMLSASIGIAMPRFFKKMWTDERLCGLHVWFSIHRGSMVLAFLVGIAAFIIIFVEVEGYSNITGEGYEKAHPVLGIIVTCLLFINPFMSLLRCKPDHNLRPVFNWAHYLVGQSAHILAGLTIAFGIYLPKAQVNTDVGLPIMITYGVWHLIFFTVMTILDYIASQRQSKRVANNRFQTEMTSPNQPSAGSADKGVLNTFDDPKKAQSMDIVKNILLAVHVTVLTTLTVYMCVLIIDG